MRVPQNFCSLDFVVLYSNVKSSLHAGGHRNGEERAVRGHTES